MGFYHHYISLDYIISKNAQVWDFEHYVMDAYCTITHHMDVRCYDICPLQRSIMTFSVPRGRRYWTLPWQTTGQGAQHEVNDHHESLWQTQ
jgi:hypothetical protein